MSDDTMNRIIENVVRETVPRTIRLQVSISQSKRQIATTDGSSSLTLEETYLETDRGERYFDRRLILPDGSVSHKSSFCDGKRCANIEFSKLEPERQSDVGISHDFMTESRYGFRDAPPPFRYYHVGLSPLHEALTGAERLGRVQVIERSCENFHFTAVGSGDRRQSLVYSLDETTSVPLKIAAFSGPEQIRDQVPNWVWEATTLDNVSGRHFATTSKYSSFRVKKADTGQWVSEPDLSQTILVNEIIFDTSIPHTEFWPNFQPGVRAFDSIAKRHYVTPGAAPSTQETAKVVNPIRVAPDQGSWLPGVGVALSLAGLAAAFVLWRRSR
jgi:hypothetical protein